jgi:hypothetical protein
MILLKATAKLPYSAGLAGDLAENTFWFARHEATGYGEDQYSEAYGRVVNFYNGGIESDGVHSALAEYIDRSLTSVRICTVDTATGHEDTGSIADIPFALDPVGTGTALPAEVALCLSYKASSVSGVPAQRRKGRIYIGPLDGTFAGSVGLGYSTPNVEITTLLQEAGKEMIAGLVTLDWVVYSRTNADAYIIDAGWVDNEWDTQRRRGREATFRSTFSATTP